MHTGGAIHPEPGVVTCNQASGASLELHRQPRAHAGRIRDQPSGRASRTGPSARAAGLDWRFNIHSFIQRPRAAGGRALSRPARHGARAELSLWEVRYEGHRTKHTRRHDHGRPGTPHTRQTGSVRGATAPMPAETGRSVRHIRRRLGGVTSGGPLVARALKISYKAPAWGPGVPVSRGPTWRARWGGWASHA